jgi:hypothetical protein
MIDTPGLNGLAESGTGRATTHKHSEHRAAGTDGQP